jgi:peroxiredoxin
MRGIVQLGIVLLVAASTGIAGAQDEKKVENFTLQDVGGAKHALTDFTASKAIVLIFMSTQCPVSNGYNTRMAALDRDYRDKGVKFLGINSNASESDETIRNHAREHGFGFLILKDTDNKIADKLEATVTPEVYVLNPALELLYHGRIDDTPRGTNIVSNDLRTALDEILAGKPVSVSRTKAFGCGIKRVD